MAVSITDITEITEYRYPIAHTFIHIYTLKTIYDTVAYGEELSASDAQTIISTKTTNVIARAFESSKTSYPEIYGDIGTYTNENVLYIVNENTSTSGTLGYKIQLSTYTGLNQAGVTIMYLNSTCTGYSATDRGEVMAIPVIIRYLNKSGDAVLDTALSFSSTYFTNQYNAITAPTTMISTLTASGKSAFSGGVSANITDMISGLSPYNPDNPYENAGDSPEDSGQGEFDYDSDDIPIPDIPSVSVTATGFVTLYTPTATELKNLANYLWSDLFSLDTFKKMFNNPMDCILGLTIVPLNLPTGTAQEITVGNIVTTVSCTTCPTQYVTVDCGSFTFSKSAFTGSYLDYSPYNKVFLYLPYIGIQEINVDEFMGQTMSIVYHCDILTGAMFCYVSSGSRIIYTYSGSCAENVPLSSNDFSTTIGSIMGAASAVAGTVATVATGGMAAPAVAGTIAKGVVSTASNVMGAKPSISHSGSLGGGSGIMGVQYPYLIFNAPWLATLNEQNSYTGFASNKIVTLSDLSGYNVIEAINLSVEGATDTECDEIKRILMEGVII